jgi:hypothetical protein
MKRKERKQDQREQPTPNDEDKTANRIDELIARARADKEFEARRERMMEEQRDILDPLADS